MLNTFGVENKVINSEVKELEEDHGYMAFVAMVETLNNRLTEEKIEISDLGLVIVDEAHYNSFRKMFKFFEDCFILGVTATPLSSNIKLPMNEIYEELIVGSSIASLIEKGFLSKATIYSYDVGLGTLKVGINGDYTVSSSEELYTSDAMRSKLLYAYEQRAKDTKTLIFNNGIQTSRYVYETFKARGYDIKHLDNSHSKKEREYRLDWFKEKPNAILTSVSILTTGFDEPTIETIILNRATRSLTLYFQMIGRGSRVLENKNTFDVIDLGNNAARFGMWDAGIDWFKIFQYPQYYLENLISDDEIERRFKYLMPDELKKFFPNSTELSFDIESEYKEVLSNHDKSSVVLDRAIIQHKNIILENTDDLATALSLIRLLKDDVEDRIRRYCYCICNSTRNYKEWAIDDYTTRLKKAVMREI
jgi:type I site-specific restriction endonuclease